MPDNPNITVIRPYTPDGVVLSRFMQDTSLVRMIMGPYGSGKSSACLWELVRRSMLQAPYNNIRHTEWGVIRDTYPNLENTTLKLMLEWFPEASEDAYLRKETGYSFKVVRDVPIRVRLRMHLPDHTHMLANFTLMALDRAEDMAKLGSLQLTGGWVNEVRFVAWHWIADLFDRCRRWPPKDMGGYTWTGLIGDTNPPMVDSDYYRMAEYVKPKDWSFFRQPPGLLRLVDAKGGVKYVPNKGQDQRWTTAENIANLQAGYDYYLGMVGVHDEEYVKVHAMGEYGVSLYGQRVFTNYNDDYHCAKDDVELLRGLPLYLGFDFGHNPTAVFVQYAPWGQMRVIDELMAGIPHDSLRQMALDQNRYFDFLSLRDFCTNRLNPYITSHYRNMEIVVICDPAGVARSETEGTSAMDILQDCGFAPRAGASQLWTPRLDAVRWFLTHTPEQGKPGLLLAPRCRMLRKGFQADYKFGEIKKAGGTVLTAEPDGASITSHPHSALQYVAMELRKGAATGQPIASRIRPTEFRNRAAPVV